MAGKKVMDMLKKTAKKSERGKIIKKLDTVFSVAVRARDGKCQHCGKSSTIYNHHIFSRRHLGTRWDMENGISLCVYCHRFIAHGDPEKFRDFIIGRMGEDKFTLLKWKAYTVTRFNINELAFLLKGMGEHHGKL